MQAKQIISIPLSIGTAFLGAVAIHGTSYAANEIQPHRAVYDVSLNEASSRSGIIGMNGKIVYEITGGVCEGTTIRYRFVANMSTKKDAFTTDQRTSTYESADGNLFQFSTRSLVNQRHERIVSGKAILEGGKTLVKLDSPKQKKFEFSPSLFMVAHIKAILKAAKAGIFQVSHQVFDGSGDAEELVKVSTVILPKQTQSNEQLDEKVRSLLTGIPAWPVALSYFDNNITKNVEQLPSYETSFQLHANGVSTGLTMAYPDYSLKAKLVDLEYLAQPDC